MLASDYKILQMLSLDAQYRWVQSRSGLKDRVERDYRAKVFIERGPKKIELQSQADGNFRAVINHETECLYPGLRFRIYVEAPLDDSEGLHYHLRLGTGEVTRVSETNDGSVTAFVTIESWETEFEDEDEAQFAAEAKRAIQTAGDSSFEPFAKIAEKDRINEFDIDEWRAIYDWTTTDETVDA